MLYSRPFSRRTMKNLFQDLKAKKTAICLVGQGYVGLPLAHAFAKKFLGHTNA